MLRMWSITDQSTRSIVHLSKFWTYLVTYLESTRIDDSQHRNPTWTEHKFLTLAKKAGRNRTEHQKWWFLPHATHMYSAVCAVARCLSVCHKLAMSCRSMWMGRAVCGIESIFGFKNNGSSIWNIVQNSELSRFLLPCPPLYVDRRRRYQFSSTVASLSHL